MTILPRLLYLMHTLPIKIPLNFFNSLRSILLKFLWSHQETQTQIQLTRPKDQGGVGLPDFRNYYYYDSVSLASDMHPIPLLYSPWIPWAICPLSLKQHPLTGNILEVFHRIAKCSDATSSPSPLTPLKDNPDFTPGLGNPAFQSAQQKAPLLAGDCYLNGKIKEWATLRTVKNLPHMPLWSYLQLRSYLWAKESKENFHRPLTDLESARSSGHPVQ